MRKLCTALCCAALLVLPCQAQEDLRGIYVTADTGSVKLGSRTIRSGDTLTAEQVQALTGEGSLRYLPIGAGGIGAEQVISIKGKRDQAPQAEDQTVETYKNLPIEGLLCAEDPEGKALTYTLTRAPKRGEVILRQDGSFLYTPRKNKVGTDSFAFTAADPAGNISPEATITIEIRKPGDDLQYSDTSADCRFEAEWLRQTGIFAGENINGQFCFSPQKSVTRGQFLAMLLEVLEMPTDRSSVETGFLDESPLWLRPYLAAAMRSGIITGYPVDGGMEFRPDQAVTQAEAAAMISRAVDFAIPTMSAEEEPILLSLPGGAEPMTRAETAKTLYQISKLREESGLFGQLFR